MSSPGGPICLAGSCGVPEGSRHVWGSTPAWAEEGKAAAAPRPCTQLHPKCPEGQDQASLDSGRPLSGFVACQHPLQEKGGWRKTPEVESPILWSGRPEVRYITFLPLHWHCQISAGGLQCKTRVPALAQQDGALPEPSQRVRGPRRARPSGCGRPKTATEISVWSR